MPDVPGKIEEGPRPRPDVIGLCAYFGWLPSQAEREDWATLWEIQHRLQKEQEQAEFEHWQQQVRAAWKGVRA